jgi:hypothetical protein
MYEVRPEGLVMERVEGPTMLGDLAAHPWRLASHARTLATLHRCEARSWPRSCATPAATTPHGTCGWRPSGARPTRTSPRRSWRPCGASPQPEDEA